MHSVTPTGREQAFPEEGLIVSKTNLTGHITYANRLFVEVSGYSERELLGAPHSIVRHPDMPRAAFKVAWDAIASGREFFAYVKNLNKRGDHYWVFAHLTPSFDGAGHIVGYHSNRRFALRRAIRAVEPLYAQLLEVERGLPGPKAAVAGAKWLAAHLAHEKTTWDELIFALSTEEAA